jgi:hypothetical protein
MADEKPLSTWRECKAISEALGAKPLSPEEVAQKQHDAVLEQLAHLAATGPKGAELAQRLRDANGAPIEAQPGDIEAFEELRRQMRKAVAEKLGLEDIQGDFALSPDLMASILSTPTPE